MEILIGLYYQRHWRRHHYSGYAFVNMQWIFCKMYAQVIVFVHLNLTHGLVCRGSCSCELRILLRDCSTLCIGNTSFIAISTLTSEMNFYTKLISKIDLLTNKPVFKSIQISLACQQCIDAEKTHECLHMQHLIPRWQVSILLPLAANVYSRGMIPLFCKYTVILKPVVAYVRNLDFGVRGNDFGMCGQVSRQPRLVYCLELK